MQGICFVEPLYNSTVKGIKTQTRRIIKSRTGFFNVISKNSLITNIWQCDANECSGDDLVPVKPRYKLGEILYLKEPYNDEQSQYRILYKFDNDVKDTPKGFWKNKLFMPASAARHYIKITNIRAEKLQDISSEDCIKEGIFKRAGNEFIGLMFCSHKHAYAALINKISGKDTWESNPFVWVYDYELTTKL